MAKKNRDGTYRCIICKQDYSSAFLADDCRASHDIVYVPMTKTELNRLINALFIEDFRLVPDTLLVTLKKLQRKYGTS